MTSRVLAYPKVGNSIYILVNIHSLFGAPLRAAGKSKLTKLMPNVVEAEFNIHTYHMRDHLGYYVRFAIDDSCGLDIVPKRHNFDSYYSGCVILGIII
jgi:hypothetical protein